MIRVLSAACLSLFSLVVIAQAKPELPADHYKTIGAALVILLRCGADGYIPEEVTARGVRLLSRDLNGWNYSPQKLEAATQSARTDLPRLGAAECAGVMEDTNGHTLADEGNTPSVSVEAVPVPAPISRATLTPPQEDAWVKFLQEDKERTARRRAAELAQENAEWRDRTAPTPPQDAWAKFLQEDRERTARRRAGELAQENAERRDREERQRQLANRLQQPFQNLYTNPAARLPQSADGSDSYQSIMVNTPNGVVHRRCKILNGQVAYCF